MPSPDELLLLLYAAHGGALRDDEDAVREYGRVLALTDTERAEWRRRVLPLAIDYAFRRLHGRSWP